MRNRLFLISAILISIGFYAFLDLSLSQICQAICSEVWTREHRKKFRIRNNIYHHTLAPNVSVVDRWGDRYYPLTTNSLGFRDSLPRNIPIKKDGRRILFIGDSFTEGQGVTWNESFVGLIQAELSKYNISVLNAGVSSYAPAVYYAKLWHFIAEQGLSVDHVFVLIDISDIKSSASQYLLTDKNRVVGRFDPRKPTQNLLSRAGQWFKSNSITYSLLYKLRDYVHYHLKKQKIDDEFIYTKPSENMAGLMKITEHNAGSEWCFMQDEELGRHEFNVKEGIRLAKKRMTRLNQFLIDKKIGLSVGIYPWPANIISGRRDSRCESTWQQWAERHEIDLFNLFQVFMERPSPIDTIERFFIPNDVHWNPAGHKLVAQSILAHMKETNLFSLSN